MLKLLDITKDYKAGSSVVNALRGVSMAFRKSEFVSILGASGCGKTTLLNIIGGLDKYTSGDLIINGKSTKNFSDRDWDTYRNHSVGFVFQTYNLIPHQSVLQNVEIALALSGVGKKERRERAKNALIEVGLKSEINKKPNQLSGGQMQRVAIARALVNNPDIILADEPTGALDSETSVQVMDILKKVAKDRLVVMVTHNPELAEEYSTRIIKMRDGKVLSDSSPMSEDEVAFAENEEKEILQKEKEMKEKDKKAYKRLKKRPSMSFLTSFTFSLKNLFTKKGRTTLTSFAGSIGIIGIALIFAVSQGMTSYINFVQEETLSSYPLTIEAEHADLSTMLLSFMESAKSKEEHENDAVYEKTALYDLAKAITATEVRQNDLASFKKYLEKEMANKESALHGALSGVQFGYDLDMNVYTKNVDGNIIKCDTEELMAEMIADFFGTAALGDMMSSMSESNPFMSMASSSMNMWQEILQGRNGETVNPLIKTQYDMIVDGGRWPENYDEVVIVVDENNEIDDMTLYALGLKSKADIDNIINAVKNDEELKGSGNKWSYEEILGMQFRVILNSDNYVYDNVSKTYKDLTKTQEGLEILYNDKGIDLKVVGIVKPNKDSLSQTLTGNIVYGYKLTEYVVKKSLDGNDGYKNVLEAQLEDPDVDVLSGLPFKKGGQMSELEKATHFREYVTGLKDKGDNDKLIESYIRIKSIVPQSIIDGALSQAEVQYDTLDKKIELLKVGLSNATGMSQEQIGEYLAGLTEKEINDYFKDAIVEMTSKSYEANVRKVVEDNISKFGKPAILTAFWMEYNNYSADDSVCASYYDVALDFSESSYEENLKLFGFVDFDSPSKVNLYMSTFEAKDVVEAEIDKYNKLVGDDKALGYTDYVGLMMSSVTTIIDVITYVLIAFVAISLIVSSIMIGVITLISVQERTKEIGILRAIGASKRNVSNMFNAETVIIGFSAGLLGVLVTYILCIPINLILRALTGIGNLGAVLPLPVALILIAISMILTLISGIIPSRSAAKKDPVVALRTE